ncbi:MAG: glycosyl hydrolase, partial [Bacteroidales bacterium]
MRKIFWILAGSMAFIISSCTEKKGNSDKESPFEVDARVDSLMKLMTLSDKVGQLVLYTSHWDVTGPVMNQNSLDDIKTGLIGNVFNAHTVAYTRE